MTHSLAEGIPELVCGDASKLRQVLLNLVHNAIKFTSAGEINVSVGLAGKTDETLLLSFEVQDTGIGISEDTQCRLFEPFTQADGSTTRRYGGTGLGLSICKSLVELMNGRIGVRSKLDSGSTFWFTLQLKIADQRKNSRAA